MDHAHIKLTMLKDGKEQPDDKDVAMVLWLPVNEEMFDLGPTWLNRYVCSLLSASVHEFFAKQYFPLKQIEGVDHDPA